MVTVIGRWLSVCVAAGLVASASSLGAQGSNVKAPAELPSVALSADLDRVLRDYEAAWLRGDATALAALFAADGFVLQGGRAPVRGRAAIAAAYAGQGGAPLRLRALAAAAADTIGYIVGAYRYGESSTDQGKFTLTLRRDRGGQWLIFSDMDNSSRAPR
jgi:uncharacterized protein (TIGR02246 family)